MKKNTLLIWTVLWSIVFSSINCSSDKKDLPNTPETVARQWQLWVDNNEYPLARELSTGHAIEWLNWVEETLEKNALEEDTLSPAQFLSMQCTEKNNQAICIYLLDDDGFQYRDSFQLQKINGQWLVDIPEQDLIEDDMIDELFKELQEEVQ